MAILTTSRILNYMRDFIEEIDDELKDFVDDTALQALCNRLEELMNDAQEAKDNAEEDEEDEEDSSPELDDSDEAREQG